MFDEKRFQILSRDRDPDVLGLGCGLPRGDVRCPPVARRIFRMAAAASIFALALVVPSAGPASAWTDSLELPPALLDLKDAPPADPKTRPTKPTSDPSPTPEPTLVPEPTPVPEPTLVPEPTPEPSPEPSAEPSPEPAPSEPSLEPEPLEPPPPDIAGAESPASDDGTDPPDDGPVDVAAPPAGTVEPPPPGVTDASGCCPQPPAAPVAEPPTGTEVPPPGPADLAAEPETPAQNEALWDAEAFEHSAPAPAPPVSDRREVPATAAGPAERESSAAVTVPAAPLAPRGDPGRAPRPAPVDSTVVDDAVVASAGIAAGLAVVNRAPPAVAAAIEFGRLGGGWAGAIVFNLWLRRQMSARRMSQRQLAALSGVDHSTISRLLREDRQPSLTTATKLVHALRGVPSDAAEPATADFFDRMPEEVVFPARRVELALRADEELDDDQVRRLMTLYLSARRRSAESRAGPAPPQRIREPASRR
jgi:transcriptional regulator with XRE-family HTH domain